MKGKRLSRAMPIAAQHWQNDVPPEVSVICWTYNHESYVQQCLDGIVAQVTDFKTEVIVHDDCSTDRTRNIIRKYNELYPNLIRTVFPDRNQLQRGIDFVGKLFKMAEGRYVAICDGDDYWCDVEKLAIQLVELEKDSEAYICAHNSFILDGELRRHEWRRNWLRDSFSCLEYLQEMFFHTTSILMRKPDSTPPWLGDVMQGDYAIVLWAATEKRNKIRFIGRWMSVYRKHVGGISNSMKNRNRSRSYRSSIRIVEGLVDRWPTKWHRQLTEKRAELRLLLALFNTPSIIGKISLLCCNISQLRRAVQRKSIRWISDRFALH